MTDIITKNPLRLEPGSGPGVPYNLVHGPYLFVPLDQLDAVKAVLDRHGIDYWTHDSPVSLDGGPDTIGIEFGRSGDAAAIQRVLDSIP